MQKSDLAINEDTTIINDGSVATWFHPVSQGNTLTISGDAAKSFDLTFDNKQNGTDCFLKAEQGNIVVENLNSLNFVTSTQFTGSNSNPLITSNGGSATIQNINVVNFGSVDAALQVDQVAHLNWGGGNLTFKNIDELNVYSKGTSFMAQANQNSMPSLIFENIGVVNINNTQTASRTGIQIAASAKVDTSNTYEALKVSGVDEFCVNALGTAISLSNKSYKADNSQQWIGSANFLANISAETVKMHGNNNGLVVSFSEGDSGLDSPAGKITVNLMAGSADISGGTNGVYANNPNNIGEIEMTLSASTLSIRSDSYAIYNDSSNISLQAQEMNLEGLVDLLGTAVLNIGNEVQTFSSQNSVVNMDGTISAASGTQLNITGTRVVLGEGDSLSSEGGVALKNAVLETNGSTVVIANLTGSDSQILVNKLAEGENVKTVSIGANNIKNLKVAASGALNDTFASAQEAYAAFSDAVAVAGTEKADLVGQSGKISDAWTADSEGNVKTQTNQAMDSFGNFNAMTLIGWRNEANHLNQRLGDVRDNTASLGAWARAYGYDSSYSDDVSIDYKAASIQIGADWRINDMWLAGAALSYTDGDGSFSNGSADAESYTLAAYLSGFFSCGGYTDIVARVGRLSTDISAASDSSVFSGSYDNTAFSLSGEVGYHWKLNDTFYVEPQAELAYAFVNGDDFTGTNGASISQDDFQSLVGRLGARAGAKFAENRGTVYAHASVNHEFLGDADFEAAASGAASRSFDVNVDGTWVSYGIGAQFNTAANLNFYGTLERSSGSEYDESYRYSIGMRYLF